MRNQRMVSSSSRRAPVKMDLRMDCNTVLVWINHLWIV